MCKKLTKLVSESEVMREELAKYRSAYGDVDAAQSPEGKQSYAHAREAEVKVHLKLVEEEATLLSRRIVELEVENRGLRAEMSDLREKIGGGGGGGGGEEPDEENRDVSEGNMTASVAMKDTDGKEKSIKMGPVMYELGQDEGSEKRKGNEETERMITREGPVGGEWDPSDSQESDDNKKLQEMTLKDYEALLALRDHACILSSAIQLLITSPKNGHSSSPSRTFASPIDCNGKAQKISLNEALELLEAMLLAFIGRVEMLLTAKDTQLNSVKKVWDSYSFPFLCGNPDVESESKQECGEPKKTEKQTRKAPSVQWGLGEKCRDPRTQLSLQILWILHQWCQVKGPDIEGKQVQ